MSLQKDRQDELIKIIARPVTIKRQPKISFTYRYKTRDIVKNYGAQEAAKEFRNFFDKDTHATLFTVDYNVSYPDMKQVKATETMPMETGHDRVKKRHVETTGKTYLHLLNITDKDGKVFKTAQDKFRQIDKYIEILSGLIKQLPDTSITRVADMGSGKGYLTFALMDYLKNVAGIAADVVGVEYRADLVSLCNKVAQQSGFDTLRFEQGTIESFTGESNILIALHACDTATDDAIHKGLVSNASLIVVAPCCHKQVRREIDAAGKNDRLDFLLRHGIFTERQAEMVTDAIRALILEYHGYTVKVFEFISGEHTAKNIMITAVKNRKPLDEKSRAEILSKIDAAKKLFGLNAHYLEKLTGLSSQLRQ